MLQRALALLLAFGVLTGLSAAGGDAPKSEKTVPQVAHIRLAGALDEAPVAADPLFGASHENFRTKLERIRKAMNDPAVQGLVLHLDGLQVGFAKMEELRRALAEFRKTGKKVFTYMDSGDAKDYLVACESDHICMPAP